MRQTVMLASLFGLLAAAGWDNRAPFAAAETNWPQFRGAGARGLGGDGQNLPDTWSSTENVRWRTDLPGLGWSSPIVWGEKVFLTTAIDLGGETEKPKKGLYYGGNRDEPPKSRHQWKVYCLDLNTGEVAWEHVAHEGVPKSSHHIKNTFASETPVTDGKRLYAYFGNLGVYCYDLDGHPLWHRQTGTHKTTAGWGTASSPVLHGDALYLVDDNLEESYLLALDAQTGEELWRTDRDEQATWATPVVWTNPDRTELVVPGSKMIRSYSLDGQLLWELGGMSSVAIPTPFASDDYLYLASGYLMDKRRPVFAMRPGLSGSVTLKENETENEYIAWFRDDAGTYIPSSLLYGDYYYILTDGGMMRCYDAGTGEEIYKKKRIPNCGAVTASPWAYDGKIFALNENGVTYVVKPGPDFEVVGENALEEDDMCMATPAIAGDKLLIRSAVRLYCVQNGTSQVDKAPDR